MESPRLRSQADTCNALSFAATAPDIQPHRQMSGSTATLSSMPLPTTPRDWNTVQEAAEPALHKRVLIIGYTRLGQSFAAHLRNNPDLGHNVVGFVDDRGDGPEVLGPIQQLLEIARRQFIDSIVVARPLDNESVLAAIKAACADHLNVVVIPEPVSIGGRTMQFDTFCGFPVAVVHREKKRVISAAAKRCLDILGAAVGLVLLSPLFLILALLVAFDSRGPVFYAHTRVGKKGTKFMCYKFRTMVVNANTQKAQLRHLNELGTGFFFKVKNDPRVTRVGRYLRRHSLDELPQLFNVLRGDMSLVGPRPSPVDEFEMYDVCHLRRLDVKPGITGLWQIEGRRSPAFEKAMVVDREYIERWNIWLDLKILLKTVSVITQGD